MILKKEKRQNKQGTGRPLEADPLTGSPAVAAAEKFSMEIWGIQQKNRLLPARHVFK